MAVLPIAGTVILIAALAIAGSPPFNIFLSEYTILKAAVDGGNWVTFSLFIIFATIIFAGLLRNFGSMVFGKPNIDYEQENEKVAKKGNRMGLTIIVVMAVIMLVLGLYIPGFLDEMLNSSVKIITGD